MKNFAKKNTAVALSILIGSSILPISQVSAEKETVKNVKSSMTQKDEQTKGWSDRLKNAALFVPFVFVAGAAIAIPVLRKNANARTQIEMEARNLINEYGQMVLALNPYKQLANSIDLGRLMPATYEGVTFDASTFNEIAFWDGLADRSGGRIIYGSQECYHNYPDEIYIARRIVLSQLSDIRKTFETIVASATTYGIPLDVFGDLLNVNGTPHMETLSRSQLSGFVNSIRGPINALKDKMKHIGHIKCESSRERIWDSRVTTPTGKTVLLYNAFMPH